MLYWFYQHFGAEHYVPGLNLLKYLSFRTVLSIATAQIVVIAMG